MPQLTEAPRIWYRHQHDGRRGYLAVNGRGDRHIRMDDAGTVEIPLTTAWVPERRERPLNDYQVAMVSFVADRALCKFLGIRERKSEWIQLLDEERIAWRDIGPQGHPLREALYDAVKSALHEAALP